MAIMAVKLTDLKGIFFYPSTLNIGHFSNLKPYFPFSVLLFSLAGTQS